MGSESPRMDRKTLFPMPTKPEDCAEHVWRLWFGSWDVTGRDGVTACDHCGLIREAVTSS